MFHLSHHHVATLFCSLPTCFCPPSPVLHPTVGPEPRLVEKGGENAYSREGKGMGGQGKGEEMAERWCFKGGLGSELGWRQCHILLHTPLRPTEPYTGLLSSAPVKQVAQLQGDPLGRMFLYFQETPAPVWPPGYSGGHFGATAPCSGPGV